MTSSLIPTTSVKVGDIILMKNSPRCVIATNPESISVINYEDSTVETVVPERHVFMGNTYFYGKIVSMFNGILGKTNSSNNFIKYMMMSKIMGGNTSSSGNDCFSQLFPLMMLTEKTDIFGDIFNSFDSELVTL